MRGSGYQTQSPPTWRPKTPFERDVRTLDLRLRRLERQNTKPRNEENEVTEVIRDRDKIIEEKYSKESLILFSCLCSLLTLVVVGFIAVILIILWRTSSLPFFRSDYFPPVETHLHNRGLAIDSGIAFSSNYMGKMDSKKIIPIRRIGNDPESGPGLIGISEWTLRKMNSIGREKNFLKENEQFQFSEESSIAIVFKIVYTRIGEDINLSDFQQANEEGKFLFIYSFE
jgi:hypothetical protein